MGQKFNVEATSDFPPAKMAWGVDLGDDPAYVLLYTNLGYDLIGAAMMKLGAEFSQFLIDEDRGRLNDAMAAAQKALRSGPTTD